jgi:ATP-dependent DNA ligase
MLRVSDCYYKSGGRSSELLKVKLFKDDEFEIIGAHEGKGKSEGQATFICRTKAGDEFNCRPRGEDALREYYWKHKDSFVGKMLTVRYFEWTTGPNPVPRFPVGIAVRDYE